MALSQPKEQKYDESAIQVLKPLEAVQKRPGMYTRTDCPLHIGQEVLDNACDEALGGFGTRIEVTAWRDGSISVQDEGRGIPVGIHKSEGKPVVEVVFTQLHAGGKFNKDNDTESAYRFAGGLHGVGVTVTNALSSRLLVQVKRDKEVSEIEFSFGEVTRPLSKRGTCLARETGTFVRFWPSAKFFDSGVVPINELQRICRAKAMLLKGVTFVFKKEIVEGTFEINEYLFEDGISDFLKQELSEYYVPELFFSSQRFETSIDAGFAIGEGAEYAIFFQQEGSLVRESYVNLIHTPHGGTHESGLRDGVFNAVRSWIEQNSLMPRGVKLTSDDVCNRLSFIVSAKVLDPLFKGQTKESLGTRDAVKLVSQSIKDNLELWLSEHTESAKLIADMAIKSAQARLRSAQKVERKKSSGVATLPGKLTDCESTDIERNEVYLVEGDSAGGSAKMGRDKECQAILPLRGKVLNSWEVDPDRLFANREIHDISVAVGVEPHSHDQVAVDLSGLRYGKICILSDADVDGSHIQVLLLTLFYRHFPALVRHGHVYVAQPPLYKVEVPAVGKSRPAQKIYCLDEDELTVTREKLALEGFKDEKITVSRFKGLGEMSAEQLWETTLNPDTRRLVQLRLDDFSGSAFDEMNQLMGKGEAQARRELMEAFGSQFDGEE